MSEKQDCCAIFTTQPISYAMAYVPFQSWEQPYDPAVGLQRGTIFPGLDKPFLGEEAIPNGR
jgi:hypothetical protein